MALACARFALDKENSKTTPKMKRLMLRVPSKVVGGEPVAVLKPGCQREAGRGAGANPRVDPAGDCCDAEQADSTRHNLPVVRVRAAFRGRGAIDNTGAFSAATWRQAFLQACLLVSFPASFMA